MENGCILCFWKMIVPFQIPIVKKWQAFCFRSCIINDWDCRHLKEMSLFLWGIDRSFLHFVSESRRTLWGSIAYRCTRLLILYSIPSQQPEVGFLFNCNVWQKRCCNRFRISNEDKKGLFEMCSSAIWID